ncbi:MAG: hypothetical protein WC055_00430 [Melioribacteraceae bacterium]
MDKENIRLGIGLPLVDDKVHTAFLDSFVMMKKPNFVYIRPTFPSMQIDVIRNQLVKQALESGCTHLLMLDTDQVYHDPDMISKMLEHDKDVVSAIVHRRYPGFDPITLRGEPGKYLMVPDEEILAARELDNHLIEIDATGGGCLLYKTEVFLKIPPAWFEFSRTEGGDVIGEDVNFCYKLKQNGYKIYCDTSIDIGHLSNLEINWATYRLYGHLKKLQKEDENKKL